MNVLTDNIIITVTDVFKIYPYGRFRIDDDPPTDGLIFTATDVLLTSSRTFWQLLVRTFSKYTLTDVLILCIVSLTDCFLKHL